jgi:hypothetical protein
MMKTSTKVTLSLFILMIAFQMKAWAQPNVYLCNTGTATLVPHPENDVNGTYAATDTLIWKHTFNNVTTAVDTTVGASPNYTTPNNLLAGEHSYTVEVKTAATCPSDISTAFKVYKLPSFSVSLANPTVANYCTNGTLGSVLVATVTPAASLPSDITMDYTWTISKTVNNATSAATLGDVGGAVTSNSSLTNTFTMNTSTVGTYNFVVKAKYVSAANVTIKSGASAAGCEDTAVNSPNVIVSPKPEKPAIKIL